jgi:oligoribonuclease
MNRATLLSHNNAASGSHSAGGAAIARDTTREAQTDIVRRVADPPATAPSSGPSTDDDRLVWVDLEMTGLDVDTDVIVEIACIVTDSNLEALDDGIQLVVRADAAELARMSDFVREMHRKSGLLPKIEKSPIDVAGAQDAALAYVKGHVGTPSTAPCCGNSIGTDRRFLGKYMPDFDEYLHYRSIDVSSLKELCRRWYPAVYRKRPGKAEQHRALDDIRESIEELRFYRANLLIPAPDPKPA